jgi:hypothetical protein
MNAMSNEMLKVFDYVTLHGKRLQIRDYTIKDLHRKQNDYRTKKVPTVVWSLFDDQGNEYRKTSAMIEEESNI